MGLASARVHKRERSAVDAKGRWVVFCRNWENNHRVSTTRLTFRGLHRWTVGDAFLGLSVCRRGAA